MKKIGLIILGLLCGMTVSAVRLATPYTGMNGEMGVIYTTSSTHRHTNPHGVAAAPTIAMISTSASLGAVSRSSGRGITTTSVRVSPRVQGFTTMASTITGGVTTAATFAQMGGMRRAQAYPGEPGCNCSDEDGDGKCDYCGEEFDEYDGCPCGDDCRCPLDMSSSVIIFMAALACAYVTYKTRMKEDAADVLTI